MKSVIFLLLMLFPFRAVAQSSIDYNQLGLEKTSLGNFEGAIQDFDSAIDLDPEFADAYNNRANAKYHLGDYAEAIKDYKRAVALNPEFSVIYYNWVMQKLILRVAGYLY